MAGIKTAIPKLMMKLQGVPFGPKCAFYGVPVIVRTRNSRIELGSGVVCISSFLANLAGLYQRSIILARDGGSVVLGDNVRLSAATLYSRSSISVGKNTCIGANTKIFDHDFHPVDPAQRLNHPDRGMKTAPVYIGENVFIGCNCIILKGSEIGDNCVVGAGAVVSGRFPENCIIAGNPAKIVRRLQPEPIAP